MIREIDYIGGSSELVIELLQSPIFNLNTVIDYNGRLNDEIKKELFHKRIAYFNIWKKEDIGNIKFRSNIVLMHKFGYILPQDLIRGHRVFNMHKGSLSTNRGAHPVAWSILLQEKETCLTLYELSDKIDLGIIIDTYPVIIDACDDTLTLERKLNGGFQFLLERFDQYLSGNIQGIPCNHGIYRRRITSNDYTLDFFCDSFAVMCAKVKSQAAYHNALIEISGKTQNVKSVKRLEKGELPEGNNLLIRKIDGLEDLVVYLDN